MYALGLYVCLFTMIKAQEMYLYPEFNYELKLDSNPIDMINIQTGIVTITLSNYVRICKFSHDLKETYWTYIINDTSNSYLPIKLVSDNDKVYVAINVIIGNIEGIALNLTNPNYNIRLTNGVILVLDTLTGTEIQSYWVDDCYTTQSKITDIALLNNDLIVAGQNACNSGFLIRNSIKKNLQATIDLKIAATLDKTYVMSGELLMVVELNGNIQMIKAIEYGYSIFVYQIDEFQKKDNIVIGNNNQIALFDNKVDIIWKQQIVDMGNVGKIIKYDQNGLFLISSGQLSWISNDGQKLASRKFDIPLLTIGKISTSDFIILTYQSMGIQTQPLFLQTCHPTCSTCFGYTQSECYSCKNYQTGAFECGQCLFNCSQCKSRTTCDQCNIGYVLINNQCLIDRNCPTGTYTSPLSCEPCNSTCQSCNGPNENNCIQCKEGDYLDDGKCVGICPQFKYSKDGVCIQCHPSCASCNGEKSTNCTSCNTGQVLYSGQCIDQCPEATYKVDRQCYDCIEGCLLCQNSQGCNQCKNGFYKYQDQCWNQCPEMYQAKGNICEPCPQNCKTCNSTQCQQCIDNYELDNNICLPHPICPRGQYRERLQCLNCKEPCIDCSNLQTCLKCTSDYLVVNAVCELKKVCNQGMYLSLDNSCEQCPCAACDGYDNCTKCFQNDQLLNGKCLQQCPEGYKSVKGKCEQCSMGCLECSDKCLRCQQGYYLVNGECLTECPSHLFVKNGQCEECLDNCQNCSEFGECTQCKKGYALEEQQCKVCPELCVECLYTQDKNQQCTKCVEGAFLNDNFCYKSCPKSTYSNVETCLPCGQHCANCINGSECLECDLNVYRFGYYQLSIGQCDKENLDCSRGMEQAENGCTVKKSVIEDSIYQSTKFVLNLIGHFLQIIQAYQFILLASIFCRFLNSLQVQGLFTPNTYQDVILQKFLIQKFELYQYIVISNNINIQILIYVDRKVVLIQFYVHQNQIQALIIQVRLHQQFMLYFNTKRLLQLLYGIKQYTEIHIQMNILNHLIVLFVTANILCTVTSFSATFN